MTIRTTFADYLRTGRIGPIGVGSTRAQLFKHFGRPEYLKKGRYGVVICQYGSVEIGLEDSALSHAKISWLQVEKFNNDGRELGYGRLSLDAGTSRPRDLLDARFLQRFAMRNGIRLTPGKRVTGDRVLLTPGHVGAIFIYRGPDVEYEDERYAIATFSANHLSWMASRVPLGFRINRR